MAASPEDVSSCESGDQTLLYAAVCWSLKGTLGSIALGFQSLAISLQPLSSRTPRRCTAVSTGSTQTMFKLAHLATPQHAA
jgi:hypothetical protein